MADIALRFYKDMLTISSPIQELLRIQGIQSPREVAMALMVEPETIQEAYRVAEVAGTQCMVTPLADFAPARLVAIGAEGKGRPLAHAAIEAASAFTPQHLLVQLAPCGLPLDVSHPHSLRENRDQYARAARFFENETFDAFFLNGFTTIDDMKCAIMGVRMVSDKPLFASVDVRGNGTLASGKSTWRQAVEMMAEHGVAVIGFSTTAGPTTVIDFANEARSTLASCGSDACMMATLRVFKREERLLNVSDENPYGYPDSLLPVALRLRDAGVQFLRAGGAATPAYAAVLAAAVSGSDVVVPA